MRLKPLIGSHADFQVNEKEPIGKKLYKMWIAKKRYVNGYGSELRFGVPGYKKLCQLSGLPVILDQK